MVTFSDYGQDGNKGGIFGRVYDSSGAAVGDDFQVNTYTTHDQIHPSANPTVNGFVVTWQS